MKNTARVYIILFMIGVFLVRNGYASDSGDGVVKDTYTPEDKAALESYKNNDMENDIEKVPLKDYIASKLGKEKSNSDKRNGLKMIYELTKDHRRHFDLTLISFLEEESKTDLPYLQYRMDGGTFVYGLNSLGITRTDLAVKYLLSLMEPVENWPAEIQNNFALNKDRERWVHEIRVKTVGALLEPIDEVGRLLVSVIEKNIDNFPDDETKGSLLNLLNASKKNQNSEVREFRKLD